MKKLIVIAFLAVWAFLGAGIALAVPAAPTMERPVVDTTGTLTPEDIDRISTAVGNRPSQPDAAQIAVALIDSLDGDTVEAVGERYAKAWGLGSKDHNNGVLILVAKRDRKIRIEVADGASAGLTDAESGRIINDIMVPKLKKGSEDWAGALAAAGQEARNATDGLGYLDDYDNGSFSYAALLALAMGFTGAAVAVPAGAFRAARKHRETRAYVLRIAKRQIESIQESIGIVDANEKHLSAKAKRLAAEVNTAKKSPDASEVISYREAVERLEKARKVLAMTESAFSRSKRSYEEAVARSVVGSSEKVSKDDEKTVEKNVKLQ